MEIEDVLDFKLNLIHDEYDSALHLLRESWVSHGRPMDRKGLLSVLKGTLDDCGRRGVTYPRIFLRRKGELIRNEFQPPTLPHSGLVKFATPQHSKIPKEWLERATRNFEKHLGHMNSVSLSATIASPEVLLPAYAEIEKAFADLNLKPFGTLEEKMLFAAVWSTRKDEARSETVESFLVSAKEKGMSLGRGWFVLKARLVETEIKNAIFIESIHERETRRSKESFAEWEREYAKARSAADSSPEPEKKPPQRCPHCEVWDGRRYIEVEIQGTRYRKLVWCQHTEER